MIRHSTLLQPIALMLGLASWSAKADPGCKTSSPVFDFGTIHHAAPADAVPVGTPLTPWITVEVTATCDPTVIPPPVGLYMRFNDLATTPGKVMMVEGARYYAWAIGSTDVSGGSSLYVIFYDTDDDFGPSAISAPVSSAWSGSGFTSPPYIVLKRMRARLVKGEGRFVDGATHEFPASPLLFITFHEDGFPIVPGNEGMLTVRGSFISDTYTCTVSDATQDILMDEPAVESFAAVGTRLSGADFSLNVSCPPAPVPVKIFTTLSDPSDTGNRSSILQLSSGSTATGLHLELSHSPDGSVYHPVRFGPDSSAAGAQNQFQLTVMSLAGGSYQAQFKVEYVQDQPEVTGGTANAAAGVTMSYQ